MEAIRQFRVWNYQMDRWTDGFVHFALPKNDMIIEKTNLDILGRVLVMKNRNDFSGHDAPQFKKWLQQIKSRTVSVQSPEYKKWLTVQN
jgi:hypothetical protein